METPTNLIRQLRAVLALSLAFFFLCAGTPGLRGMNAKVYLQPEKRQKIERRAGPEAAAVYFAIAELNHRFRQPIAARFNKLQSLFRISQSWGLYGQGPMPVRWLVIEVDQTPIYQTNEPAHAWRAHQLAHRKLRALPETLVEKPRAYNWTSFSEWVRTEALQDFPDAKEVSVLAVWGTRDIRSTPTIHHGRRARYPDWNWIALGANGEPLPADQQSISEEQDNGEDE